MTAQPLPRQTGSQYPGPSQELNLCPTCGTARLCSKRILPPDGSPLGDLCVLPLDHAGPCKTYRQTHRYRWTPEGYVEERS